MFKLTLSNPRVWQFQCLRNVEVPHRKGCVNKLLLEKESRQQRRPLFCLRSVCRSSGGGGCCSEAQRELGKKDVLSVQNLG